MADISSLLLATLPGDLNTSPRIILIIVHIIAVVLGVGGATASDVIFFKSISDGRITTAELSFLKTMSILVWAGLTLAVLSGLGFVILAGFITPELQSAYSVSKIITKVIITMIITLNGIALHLFIMPIFEKNLEQPLVTSKSFRRYIPIIFTSGALSATSWYTVLIMGAWRGFNVPVSTSLSAYGLLLTIAIIGANLIAFLFMRSFKRQQDIITARHNIQQ